MPITTLASIGKLITEGLAAARVRFPGKATDPASFIGTITRTWAMGLFGLQRTAEAIDRDSPPSNKSSELGIVTWADVSGVPSNLGGYGRNGATRAQGGAAPVTGTAGTSVLAGQQLAGPDGTTIFELVNTVTIPATGSFRAVTPGSAGNLPTDTTLTWSTPPLGCDPTVLLTSPTKGGEDIETIAHLVGRTIAQWQTPPKGGADIDYQGWAEEIDGVDTAYLYPLRDGGGTVHVVCTAPGSGIDRIPSASVIDDVNTKFRAKAPTDVDEALAMGPSMPAGRALTVRARAYLASGYSWDWQEGAGTWTVVAYSGAGPITLEVDNVIPQSLRDAIDSGDQPLVQVVSTSSGAPVVPQQVRATAYDGTLKVLTLATALAVDPTAGDSVHAGSYAAPLAAQAMYDAINALGPSRASGYASSSQQWQDVASIWALGGAALAVVDTDGSTRLLTRLADVNGVTIAVGAGSPQAADFIPEDTYTLPPELARAARCYVTQVAA